MSEANDPPDLGTTTKPKPAERQYHTVVEAAKVLDVSPSTVWRWIQAERLSAYRVGPRTIRLKKEDLEQMMRPVREKPPEVHTIQPWVSETVSEEEIARRQALVARLLEERDKHRSIAPFTTADLVRQVREQRIRRHASR